MKPIKYIIATLAFLLTGIQSQAQQTPCELDTSYAVPGGNYETLSETYFSETPPDTVIPDTVIVDTMELADSTRNVFWMHGLGGNETAWNKMSPAFAEGGDSYLSRKIKERLIDYSIHENSRNTRDIGKLLYNNDVALYNSLLEDELEDYDPERSILIAHSQGGIVARQMDRFMSDPDRANNFGGFATFATSNQGAQIINNQTMVSAFLEDMADDLLEGPTENLVSSDRFFIRLIAKWADVADLKDTIVQFFADDIGEYLITQSYPETTKDYAVPDPNVVDTINQIEALNEYVSESEGIIAFFSRAKLLNTIEHEDILRTYEFDVEIPWWCLHPVCHTIIPSEHTQVVTFDVPVGISLRTLNYFISSPPEMPAFTAQDSFHNFAIKYHKTHLDYQAQVDRNAEMAYGCDFCVNVGLYMKKRKRARDRMRAWQKGVDYLNSFDRRYRAFVGILQFHTQIDTEYYCDCTESVGDVVLDEYTVGPFDEMPDCSAFGGDPLIECISRVEENVINPNYNSPYNLPSDGIVLEESAKEIPQATRDPVEIKPGEEDEHLGGATHMELRNTSYTRDELDRLFSGAYGDFFETPKDE